MFETGAPQTESGNRAAKGECLVVVPTYNEAFNIVPLINEILGQGPEFDVLVVDDNSPDGTGDLVSALSENNSRVQLLRRAGKQGLGTAYIAGFRHALDQGYAYVFEMDADFSHQPHYLPILLEAAQRECDVALGSRNVAGGRVENCSRLRQFISRGGSLYARSVLNVPVHDVTGGFKCFRSHVLNALDFSTIGSSGYAFQIEMNYRCHQAGFRIKEIPIVFPNRVAGQSKMSMRIIREAAVVVLKLRLSGNPFQRTLPSIGQPVAE